MTITLKIFKDSKPEVGQQAMGFVMESMDSPFTAETFITTQPILAIAESNGITVLQDGAEEYELERISKPIWMQLMAKLDAFRSPNPTKLPKSYPERPLEE